MSCERNGRLAGLAGKVTAGVSELSSKAGSLAGAIAIAKNRALDQADRVLNTVGEKSAPVTSLVANQTKKGGRRNDPIRALRIVTAGAVLAGSKAAPVLGAIKKAVLVADKITGAVGSGAGALSKTGEAGWVEQEKRRLLFFKKKEQVALWESNLTPMINRRDAMVAKKESLVSSKGVMFSIEGKTWHSGTTRVKTSGGERTVGHLQSMSMPAAHYFFSRPISGEQAVGIVTGKVKPETVSGFVGQVSPTESLCPAWAQAKQSLIKAHIHWPDRK